MVRWVDVPSSMLATAKAYGDGDRDGDGDGRMRCPFDFYR